jgi:hypothetical protein
MYLVSFHPSVTEIVKGASRFLENLCITELRYLIFWLGGLNKTWGQGSRSPGVNSNHAPSKYKSKEHKYYPRLPSVTCVVAEFHKVTFHAMSMQCD